MLLIELASALVIGLGVGLVSSVLGLGGGIVIVPLLPLAAAISARETIGTSLLTVFFVTSFNAWRFHLGKLVVWKVGLFIGVFAALGSFTAATLTGFVAPYVLHLSMGTVLLLLVFFMLWRRKSRVAEPALMGLRQRNVVSSGIGLMSGLVSGFTGIGGGVLITPLLARLKTVPNAQIVPTSNAAIILTSAAGTLALVKAGLETGQGGELGLVRWDLGIALFLGAMISAIAGRRLQGRFNPLKRDWLIGFLLLALSLLSIIKGLREYGG